MKNQKLVEDSWDNPFVMRKNIGAEVVRQSQTEPSQSKVERLTETILFLSLENRILLKKNRLYKKIIQTNFEDQDTEVVGRDWKVQCEMFKKKSETESARARALQFELDKKRTLQIELDYYKTSFRTLEDLFKMERTKRLFLESKLGVGEGSNVSAIEQQWLASRLSERSFFQVNAQREESGGLSFFVEPNLTLHEPGVKVGRGAESKGSFEKMVAEKSMQGKEGGFQKGPGGTGVDQGNRGWYRQNLMYKKEQEEKVRNYLDGISNWEYFQTNEKLSLGIGRHRAHTKEETKLHPSEILSKIPSKVVVFELKNLSMSLATLARNNR